MLSIKPGPIQAVNLYGRANGNVDQFISFLEKWVHAGGLHQGNKENEESCPAPPRGLWTRESSDATLGGNWMIGLTANRMGPGASW
jgi:hypothetical protein